MMVRSDAGFTLVETMLALLVFAVSVAGLQQMIGSGWKSLRTVRYEMTAIEHARALLAASAANSALNAGTTNGVVGDGYRWQIEVVQTKPEPQSAAISRFSGFWITATVSWQDGRGGAASRSTSLQTFVVAGGSP
jgi:prepilin-type N-terminal cleavage/methylation domain-containing protein